MTLSRQSSQQESTACSNFRLLKSSCGGQLGHRPFSLSQAERQRAPCEPPFPWANKQGLLPIARPTCQAGLGKGKIARRDQVRGEEASSAGSSPPPGAVGHPGSAAACMPPWCGWKACFKTPTLPFLLFFLSLTCRRGREGCSQVQLSARTPSLAGTRPLTPQGAIYSPSQGGAACPGSYACGAASTAGPWACAQFCNAPNSPT